MGSGLGLRQIPVAFHAFVVLWGGEFPSRTAVRGAFFSDGFPCPCHPSSFAEPLSVARSFPMRTARRHISCSNTDDRPTTSVSPSQKKKNRPVLGIKPYEDVEPGNGRYACPRKAGSGDASEGLGWKLHEGYVIGLGNWGRSPMGGIRGEVMPTQDGTPPRSILVPGTGERRDPQRARRTSAVAAL